MGYTVLANAANNKISTTLNREGFRVMYCTPSYECKGLVLTYIRAVLPTFSFLVLPSPYSSPLHYSVGSSLKFLQSYRGGGDGGVSHIFSYIIIIHSDDPLAGIPPNRHTIGFCFSFYLNNSTRATDIPVNRRPNTKKPMYHTQHR